MATTQPSNSPSRTLRILESTFPRIGSHLRSGRNASSCTERRGEEVPTLAPGARSARCPAPADTRASLGSARRRKPANSRSGPSSAGRSLALWMAPSTCPLRRASSRREVNHPCPGRSGARAAGLRSPSESTTTAVNSSVGNRDRSAAIASSVWARASALPLVASAINRPPPPPGRRPLPRAGAAWDRPHAVAERQSDGAGASTRWPG